MEAINGVLWDMDGVLVSTGEYHFQAWTKTLSTRGIPFSREQFRTTFGMNNTGILQLLLGKDADPELIIEISDDKEKNFRQAIKGEVQPLPGVQDWLKLLKEWGVKQAVASSAPSANIDALLDELRMRTLFDAVVSGANLPGKPDPAVFLEAARQIGVPPERCVVIEDAVAGVQAAKRAGITCIAVTTTNTAHELQDADLIVERMIDVTENDFTRLFQEVHR